MFFDPLFKRGVLASQGESMLRRLKRKNGKGICTESSLFGRAKQECLGSRSLLPETFSSPLEYTPKKKKRAGSPTHKAAEAEKENSHIWPYLFT